MKLPTIRVVAEHTRAGYITINEADYRRDKRAMAYKLWRPPEEKEKEPEPAPTPSSSSTPSLSSNAKQQRSESQKSASK